MHDSVSKEIRLSIKIKRFEYTLHYFIVIFCIIKQINLHLSFVIFVLIGEMGNCAIKPKVLKDTDEDLIPVERDTMVHNKVPAEKNAPNAADERAAAALRSEKGKVILIDDVEDAISELI